MEVYFDGTEISKKGGILPDDNRLPPRIDFKPEMKVDDEIRGYVIKLDNDWIFLNRYTFDSINNNKRIIKIALVLESPHKDEYSTNYTPIRPANGKTGDKINNKIVEKMGELSINEKDFTFNDQYIYEIFIINPVQYQASCFHELCRHNKTNEVTGFPKVTDTVFRLLFNHLQDDFIDRLFSYKPNYIINACTGGMQGGSLQSRVNNVMKEKMKENELKIPIYRLHHPSDW